MVLVMTSFRLVYIYVLLLVEPTTIHEPIPVPYLRNISFQTLHAGCEGYKRSSVTFCSFFFRRDIYAFFFNTRPGDAQTGRSPNPPGSYIVPPGPEDASLPGKVSRLSLHLAKTHRKPGLRLLGEALIYIPTLFPSEGPPATTRSQHWGGRLRPVILYILLCSPKHQKTIHCGSQ